jgi:hypothetical protein
MCKQHRDVIDGAESVAFQIIDKWFRDLYGFHTKGRLSDLVPWQIWAPLIAGNYEDISDSEFVGRNYGSVNFDCLFFGSKPSSSDEKRL